MPSWNNKASEKFITLLCVCVCVVPQAAAGLSSFTVVAFHSLLTQMYTLAQLNLTGAFLGLHAHTAIRNSF